MSDPIIAFLDSEETHRALLQAVSAPPVINPEHEVARLLSYLRGARSRQEHNVEGLTGEERVELDRLLAVVQPPSDRIVL